MPASTDAEFVALARRGHREAYGRLVSRYQTLVASLAYSVSGDFAHSQDIAQEAFVVAWRQLRSLGDPAKFKPWLCGITRNLAHNAIRRRSHRPDRLVESNAAPEWADSAPGPRERAVSREEALLVWQALEKLPEAYREPLILFYREHQSIERVANALELSPDTVKQRLSRGRAMLREQMEHVLERSLATTVPREAFTAAVLGALPDIASHLGPAGATAAATKAGASSDPALSTGNLFASFLAHLAVAWGGYRWQSKRKTPPPFRLAGILIGWGSIAATAFLLWLATRHRS